MPVESEDAGIPEVGSCMLPHMGINNTTQILQKSIELLKPLSYLSLQPQISKLFIYSNLRNSKQKCLLVAGHQGS